MLPLIKEVVRQQKRKLDSHWSEIAEEYDYRKRKYNKHLMQSPSASVYTTCDARSDLRMLITNRSVLLLLAAAASLLLVVGVC